MNISGQTKSLLIISAILIAIVYFYNPSFIKNSGELEYEQIESKDIKNVSESEVETVSGLSDKEEEEMRLRKKFISKNSAKNGEYKKSSYVDGIRGNEDNLAIDDFFEENNGLVKDSYGSNDEFVGNDETGGKLATYKSGGKKKLTDEDIFRADDYLPQEQNKDWFEVMPEPISVKNRHLINVTRPVGVNTVGNSHRNMSYDIRGSIPIPRTVVSPWLQSSIEPDLNLKGLC